MDITTLLQKLRQIFLPKRISQGKIKRLILIIDDNLSDRKYFSEVLSKSSYIPIIFQGRNILDIFEKHEFCLIIIGTNAEKKTLEFCATLRKHLKTKNIPIMIAAEKSDQINIMEYYSENVDIYLRKPISKNELINQVNILVNKGNRDGFRNPRS